MFLERPHLESIGLELIRQSFLDNLDEESWFAWLRCHWNSDSLSN
jgi:hypothetical protein